MLGYLRDVDKPLRRDGTVGYGDITDAMQSKQTVPIRPNSSVDDVKLGRLILISVLIAHYHAMQTSSTLTTSQTTKDSKGAHQRS